MNPEPVPYYKVDTRQLTFAECWRLAPGIGFLVLAALKLVRIPLPTRIAIPNPDRIQVVEDSELDLDGRRRRVQGEFDSLEASGFKFQFLYKVPSINPDGDAIAAAFLSDDQLVFAAVVEAVAHNFGVTKRHKMLGFTTVLAGDRFLSTSNDLKSFDGPPNFDIERVRAKPVKLLERHRRRLMGAEAGGTARIQPENLADLILRIERTVFKYQIERGVFVELRNDQVERLRGIKPHRERSRIGRLLRGWLLWPVVVAISVVWGLRPWGQDELPAWDEEEVLYPYSCDSESMGGDFGDSQTSSSGVIEERSTLVASFGQTSDAGAALKSLLSEASNINATRMGNFLLLHSRDRSAPALEPLAKKLTQAGAQTMLDSTDLSSGVLFSLRWQPAAAAAASDSVRDYFAVPLLFYLRPPWAPGSQLSEQQSAARRAFQQLNDLPEGTAWSMYLEMFKGIWGALTGKYDDERAIDDFWREHLAETEERARKLVAEGGDVDPVTAEKFLAWQSTSFDWDEPDNPFEVEAANNEPFDNPQTRDLARHLGQLALAADPETGAMVPSDSGFLYSAAAFSPDIYFADGAAVRYVEFIDAATGLPALADYLCAAGAESIELGADGSIIDFGDDSGQAAPESASPNE